MLLLFLLLIKPHSSRARFSAWMAAWQALDAGAYQGWARGAELPVEELGDGKARAQ
jgi:hypothetical protein